MLFFIVGISSCKKFVEIDPPGDQLITVTVFNSDETAIAATTQIYSRMVMDQTLPFSLAQYTGLSSDELKNYSTNTTILPFYLNAQKSSDDGGSYRIWKLSYNYIYQANAVYEGCENSNSLSPSVKKQLMGEALFIRAFWHFYLVNLFGDIPIVISTDYTVSSRIQRSPKDKVYSQIENDLRNAEQQLSKDYVAADSHTPTDLRVRPNLYVAAALLARCYLFSGNYDLGEKEATKIIENKSVYGLETIENAFIILSKEAIWELMTPTPYAYTANTLEGFGFVLTSKPNTSSQSLNSSTISIQLLQSFENSDLRKENWIGVFNDKNVDPSQHYYYPNKYKIKQNLSPTEYSIPLRLSEQYLIRSECRAQLGNIDGSKDDLNTIRFRAGLGKIPATDKAGLLEAILHERQVELFTEWGHRWFDLKRTGKIDQVMQDVAPIKSAQWSSNQQLWPIPMNEIQNNSNLTQNPGYK